jgi:hypothetical protein
VAALASPSHAQTLAWSTGIPVYSAEGVDRVVSAEPGYTELTLPGVVVHSTGVCATNSNCLTFTSSDPTTPNAWPLNTNPGVAVVTFTLPSNETFDVCPTAAYGSQGFVLSTVLTCSVGGNVMTVQVTTTDTTTTTGPGVITFPSFSVVGSGLATLANYPLATGVLNCSSLSAACDITGFVSLANNINFENQTAVLSEQLAESSDTFSSTDTALTTSPGPSCIDIDIWSYHSNGESFQQPCSEGPIGSQAYADKGQLTIHFTGGLTPIDGTSVFGFDGNTGVIQITGSYDGNPQLGEPPTEDSVGSQNAAGGIAPLTGENMVLVPGSSCPTTLAAAVATHDAVEGVITNNVALFSPVVFPNPPSTVGGHSTKGYEVCDYATGTTVIGAVAGWTSMAAIDGPIGCAPHTPNGCSSVTDKSPMLLGFNYNGEVTWFNFTNGAYGDVAFLRIVNRNPSSPLNLGVNGEEAVCLVTGDDGQNGYASLYTNAAPGNGDPYDNGNSSNTGLTAGQNAYYPVPTIFQNAGVGASGTNPYDLGSLICFHDSKLFIKQAWQEANGIIVNIQ